MDPRAERTSGIPAARYAVVGENGPGGKGLIASHKSTIRFDGSAATGDELPGPADLLAVALAACILKNVERFSQLLPFRYERAQADVELTRSEAPPRIVTARYVLRLETDEPARRVDLLHRNIRQFGTITNTLGAACELEGEVRVEPRRGELGR